MTAKKSVIPLEQIEKRIFLLRGQKVLLSMDLAELYGVETKVLVQAVKRNLDRFPMTSCSSCPPKNWPF